jgi:ribosome biogenesis GTPase
VTSVSGTVVARYKRHCLVADADGKRVNCQLERRRLNPVVGDTVQWQLQADMSGTLTSIAPRATELTRIDNRGRPEVIAANLSQLVIVLAPDPAPDWFLLDRYLAAAELAGFKAVIAFNKTDLRGEPPGELDDYASLGYTSCRTSATNADGLDKLTRSMAGHRSVMIGQSGVGKSSLLNALLGDKLQAVGALSEKSGHGRHTTSTAVLYTLPGDGELIDSPGVRDYSPFIADPRDVASGFREFKPLLGTCRFQDCGHLVEPDCAIKAALSAGQIVARRYASYERLYALTETLQSERY